MRCDFGRRAPLRFTDHGPARCASLAMMMIAPEPRDEVFADQIRKQHDVADDFKDECAGDGSPHAADAPLSRVPPTTTAVIAVSSQPSPVVELAELNRGT